ncbi:MAG: phosphate ABC transporter permease subunit PstC [Rectinemataceae bacterium]|jgi:phosphate ABC transporter permease protein PstC
MTSTSDKAAPRIFLAVACTTILCLLVIAAFIFKEGLPFLFKVGLGDFLLSSDWRPDSGHYGIFPMILSSLWVTFGALLVGAPLGMAGAVFLSEFSPPPLMRIVKPAIELLAGIPSVVFGFIGVMVLAPFIRRTAGGPGLSVLAAAIVLGVMILPTIMSIAIDSLGAVPQSYREGALALGATRWQAVHMVVLKAARSGLLAGTILGMGRAIGETMAVIMVAGNAVKMPLSPLDSARTLTANIALEMGYATGLHRQALFATGIVLFIVIVILNGIATAALKRRTFRR